MVGKTVDALAQIKAVAPDPISSHHVLHCHIPAVKKKKEKTNFI
jgi:hypothetical protein